MRYKAIGSVAFSSLDNELASIENIFDKVEGLIHFIFIVLFLSPTSLFILLKLLLIVE